MADRRRVNERRYWVDSGSGSGSGGEVPVERLDELPAPSFLPRLSKLRGIRPAVPGPVFPHLEAPAVPAEAAESPVPTREVPAREGENTISAVPAHVEVDALRTILERHVTGADGICFCGERAGEFTGRCRSGRKAAKRLTALGFMGYEIPAPPGWKSPDG